jgi:hypothetical protein
MPGQGCNHPVQVPWHDHRFVSDDLLLALPVYRATSTEADVLLSSKSARKLGALRPNARLAFYFLTLFPNRCRLGRNPRRRSNPRMVDGSFDRPNPYAVLHLLGEDTVFQDFVTCLPSQPTRRRSLTLNKHRFLQTGDCPCLPSSNLYHHSRLPLQLTRAFS